MTSISWVIHPAESDPWYDQLDRQKTAIQPELNKQLIQQSGSRNISNITLVFQIPSQKAFCYRVFGGRKNASKNFRWKRKLWGLDNRFTWFVYRPYSSKIALKNGSDAQPLSGNLTKHLPTPRVFHWFFQMLNVCLFTIIYLHLASFAGKCR